MASVRYDTETTEDEPEIVRRLRKQAKEQTLPLRGHPISVGYGMNVSSVDMDMHSRCRAVVVVAGIEAAAWWE